MRAKTHKAAIRMAGQVMTEYVIVAGILAIALFVKVPWADKSVFYMLIEGFRKAWVSYSYTISLPW
ncbi:hypothetical protein CLU86_4352 [Acidovorax sp. 62]|uniref:hypothetical protein n=1 Tax=Acidovorax sp. 62 TaxID=2035203 RepID=UPI000C5A88ED|nr:hypothetical protein [Acidovorax sp. 62]PIF93392.1 hypothetical protein CLU86_4352 [Acidovorax sp. 62]